MSFSKVPKAKSEDSERAEATERLQVSRLEGVRIPLQSHHANLQALYFTYIKSLNLFEYHDGDENLAFESSSFDLRAHFSLVRYG